MTESIKLIIRLALAKFNAGELTEAEVRSVLDECMQTAFDYGVLPDCFEPKVAA